MVLSRKKLKRKLTEEEAVAAIANPESAKEQAQVKGIEEDGAQKKEKKRKRDKVGAIANTESVKKQAQVKAVGEDGLQKKEKKRKRDKVVDEDELVVQSAGDHEDGNGGVETENPVGGENAAKNKKKKEKKKRIKGGSEVAAAGDEDRRSNGTLNGAVDQSGAEAEPTPIREESGDHEENGSAENGGQLNGGQETVSGDHKGVTVRERKGKKRKDRWGGAVQEQEEEVEVEAAVAVVDCEEEYKGQTSGEGIDELSAGEQYDPKKVYVGGMPYYVSEEDIVEFFSGCGKITELDCVLFPDTGKFRGLAFITFQTEEAARKALEWDGHVMGERFLKITKCKIKVPKGNKNLELGEVKKEKGCLSAYIGNLSWNITEDVLKNFLKKRFKQTKIEAIRFAYDRTSGEFRGFGHIDFGDDDSLEAAIRLNQSPLLGRPVKIAYSVPKKTALSDNFDCRGQRISPRACHSCGKEGHKAFTCPVKGGIIPERDGKVRR